MTASEVIQIATQNVRDIYPGAESMLVEEIERENNSEWTITISYYLPEENRGYVTMGRQRTYKVFRIDEQGQVLSMKIREFK